MGIPYADQLSALQARLETTLDDVVPTQAWRMPGHGPESGFRNKAKLVVGGVRGAPTVGILDDERRGVDLRHCGLYEPGLDAAVVALAELVADLDLTPYDVAARAGELKHVILTHSPDGELMVRFVLRSRAQLGKLRAGLPEIRRRLPQARVVTANLLPAHQAVLEGEEEIWLTRERELPMRVGGLLLQLRPQSFFQTNTGVAEQLYAQAGDWVAGLEAMRAWDLYCGVGGFALTVAAACPGIAVTGVEIAPEAVRSAARAAVSVGLEDRVTVEVGDATAYAEAHDAPDLVVVNPPRRGVGADLATVLDRSVAAHLLYSSCEPRTLAVDLHAMPSFEVIAARGFAMFPQTEHAEVLVLARRR